MLPDRVSNPGPLTYESGALPIALRGPAFRKGKTCIVAKFHRLIMLFAVIFERRKPCLIAKECLFWYSSDEIV